MNERLPDQPAEIRYELKLPVEGTRLSQARSWIRLHPEGFRVAYPARRVNNLYLDSPGLSDFAENLAGIDERRKLRLRWYGALPQPPLVQATLELKIKHGAVGDKRRFVLPAAVDLRQPFARILTLLQDQAPAAWREWLLRANQPALINHYQREYYVSPDGIVRCTLDYDQVFYDQRFSQRPNLSRRLLDGGRLVIEVKAPVELGPRLERAMDSFPVPRGRHSKYVDGLLSSSF